MDYESTSAILRFSSGSERECHSIAILQDTECEQISENFFANLTLMMGSPVIIINPQLTEIIIDDSNETDCGKFKILKFQLGRWIFLSGRYRGRLQSNILHYDRRKCVCHYLCCYI